MITRKQRNVHWNGPKKKDHPWIIMDCINITRKLKI